MKNHRTRDSGNGGPARARIPLRKAPGARPLALIVAATVLPVLLRANEGCAAPDPADVGLKLSITAELLHDDNLFRLPDGDPRTFGVATGSRSDTIARAGAALKYDKIISRQHLIGEAGFLINQFQHNENLDHTTGNALAKWLWVAGSQWDGELSYDFRRRMTGFADLRANIKNLVDQDTVVATAGYRLHPSWRVWGGVNYFDTNNSSPTQVLNDTEVRSALAGVDYKTAADNSIGVQVRRAEGRFPNREIVAAQLVTNEYTETNPAVAWVWNITGQTQFTGRVGYSVREHEQFSARDFSGPTFLMRYVGLPTGKLRLEAQAWRELWTAESQTSSYVVASGVRVLPTWLATAKLSVRAGLAYETRAYEGDPGVALGIIPVRDDTVRTLQLGASYAVLRNGEILLMYERGDRNSNLPGFDYDYNSVLLSFRIGFW